jgi:hypothetical protein
MLEWQLFDLPKDSFGSVLLNIERCRSARFAGKRRVAGTLPTKPERNSTVRSSGTAVRGQVFVNGSYLFTEPHRDSKRHQTTPGRVRPVVTNNLLPKAATIVASRNSSGRKTTVKSRLNPFIAILRGNYSCTKYESACTTKTNKKI